MFNPALVKPIIGITVSFCTSRAVSTVIRANMPVATTTFQKVALGVGAYGLGSAAARHAVAAVNQDIADVEEFVAAVKEAKKQETR